MTVMANGNGISQVKLDRSQSFYIIRTLAGSAITSAGMGSATKETPLWETDVSKVCFWFSQSSVDEIEKQ